MTLSFEKMQRIAALELNALHAAGILGKEYEKVSILKRGTSIYDLNGEILFYRLPLKKGSKFLGYCDVSALDDAFGEPLLATTVSSAWNEKELLSLGKSEALNRKTKIKFDELRFVAYSFPKLALQFLNLGKEVLMLELYTWAEIPPSTTNKDRKVLEPTHFERWSLLDELPKSIRKTNAEMFKTHMRIWENPALTDISPLIVSILTFEQLEFKIPLFDTREIHYSSRNTDHHVCYELRGQQTNVWCVGASVEMVLNFYRYSYDQVRLAQELGLGTLAAPNGLPYARVGDVPVVMENLTSNSLDVTMHVNPAWAVFRNEIRANRPLISFVPGHSRTVVGYSASNYVIIGVSTAWKGLLVYDPWPPNAGVVTRWENFATQIYQYAYSSVLRQI